MPAGAALEIPSGDDFTPALLQPLATATHGQALVTARAPLPLLTNEWTVESSGDFGTWTPLTNVPGLQYSATVLDSSAVTGRYYRVRSLR